MQRRSRHFEGREVLWGAGDRRRPRRSHKERHESLTLRRRARNPQVPIAVRATTGGRPRHQPRRRQLLRRASPRREPGQQRTPCANDAVARRLESPKPSPPGIRRRDANSRLHTRDHHNAGQPALGHRWGLGRPAESGHRTTFCAGRGFRPSARPQGGPTRAWSARAASLSVWSAGRRYPQVPRRRNDRISWRAGATRRRRRACARSRRGAHRRA
jgi:hypothetical protein